MRKILHIVKKKWFISLLLITLLSLIVWFIGPLVAIADVKPLETESSRLITIIVMLLAWGLNNLRISNKEKSQNTAISEEIVADAKPVDLKTPSADEAILAKRFNEAIKTLQTSKSGQKNKLYSLPWYLLIGLPGSGKTTAIQNSGLHFPLQSEFGDGPVQGSGGTRYCDWWFTNEAILLDTAGRYTEQSDPSKSDTKSWLGFLNIIKKGRPKRPINGIIVTVSVDDILNKTNTQKSIHASTLKQRIQEINHQLGMELPVYVMITKTDTIAGFTAFFEHLEKEDREEIFGFNFPRKKMGHEEYDFSHYFDLEFEQLTETINNRLLFLLDHEKSQNRRGLIHQFPHQFESFKPLLAEFLNNIFTSNQFETTLSIRGIYFISATQETMSSQWVSGCLPVKNLQPPVDHSLTEPKTFFINRLLKDLIFKEANLANINNKARKRFMFSFWSLLSLTSIVFIVTIFLWNQSHSINQNVIAQLHDEVQSYLEQTDGGLIETRNWLSLAKGLNHLRDLSKGYKEGSVDYPLEEGFGLYQGHKLGQEATNTYKKALHSFLMVDIEKLLAKQLSSHPSDEHLYESLKFYLMPYNPEKMDQETFLIWVDILLQREIIGDENQLLRKQLIEHLTTAIEEKISPAPMNTQLVEQSREQLISTPLDLRLYRRLKSDYLKSHPGEFKLSDVVGKKGALILYRASGKSLDDGIPKLFTYEGFHSSYNIQNKKLADRLTNEQWIYGDEISTEFSDEKIQEITEQVDEYYFEEYVQYWQSLIADIRIKPFNSVNQGQAVLRLLASADKPLLKIIQAIRKNTALSEAPKVSAKKAESLNQLADNFASTEKNRLERLVPLASLGPDIKLAGDEVTMRFEDFNQYAQLEDELPLAQLQAALEKLNIHFATIAESGSVAEAAFSASVTENSNTNPILSLKRAVSQAHPDVQKWFNKVASNANVVTAAATKGHVNNTWQADVVSFYEKAIKGRYPVDPTSKQDIKLEDFTAFFSPTGILQTYFDHNLKPFVDKSKTNWSFKKYIGISRKRLKIFQQADTIQKTYFSQSKSEPTVSFMLKPISLDKVAAGVILEMGGQTLTYNHGPLRTEKLTWPKDTTSQSKITFPLISRGSPISSSTDGEWAWFRLLDSYATVSPNDQADNFTLSFEVKDLQAKFTLSPQSTFNPFENNAIKNFSIPKKL